MRTNLIPFVAAFTNNTVILAYCTIVSVRSLHFCPQFCHNNKKAQKYLLGGFECLVKLHQTQLLPRVPIILKDLYDADLLEEDVILAWAEKVTCQHTTSRFDLLGSQMKRCGSDKSSLDAWIQFWSLAALWNNIDERMMRSVTCC